MLSVWWSLVEIFTEYKFSLIFMVWWSTEKKNHLNIIIRLRPNCVTEKKKFALSKVLLLLKLKVYSSEYFYKFTQYVFPLLSHITSSHHLNIYFYLIYLIWCCCLSIGEVFCCVPPLHNITFPVMLVCVISPRHIK